MPPVAHPEGLLGKDRVFWRPGVLVSMRRVVALFAAAVCGLLAAPAAFADRDADGPVGGTTEYHVEFTLPGHWWGQGSSALDGTPIGDLYILPGMLADGSYCPIHVWTTADVVATHPIVGKKRVILRPGPLFRIAFDVTHRGRHARVQWWSGVDALQPVVGAVQPAPPGLRHGNRRWVITFARIESPTRGCGRYEQRARLIARTIGRTLRLARGPALIKPPYVPFVP